MFKKAPVLTSKIFIADLKFQLLDLPTYSLWETINDINPSTYHSSVSYKPMLAKIRSLQF